MALKKIYFNRLSIGMIPLSYYESLTYEEQLLWLQKNMNEIIDACNLLQEEFESIDINFNEIQRELTAMNLSLTNLQTLVDTKASKTELEIAINDLNYNLRNLMTSEYATLKEYVDTQDDDLQYQIDHFDAQNVDRKSVV